MKVSMDKLTVGDLIYCDNGQLKETLGVCLIIDMCKTKKTWHRKLEVMSLTTGRCLVIPYISIKHCIEVVSKAKESE